ncbi:hypothetical protein JHK85_001222 [Glycine max]|nr:hypothetical protein JHK87_001197 [Glycine soja]KAG5068845.1 hypothetical protein JHK85_001222 [Glycine max]
MLRNYFKNILSLYFALANDVNHPTSAEGFTVIFNKARDEKKTGGNPDSPGKTATDPHSKPAVEPGKTQTIRCS